MTDAIFHSPLPVNEPVLSYAPGTKERELLLAEYDKRMKEKRELPMWIGGQPVETKDRRAVRPPHQHKHILGYSHHGDKQHVKQAITAALRAKRDWEHMRWEDRAAIFLKAADLISGPYRAAINAATMLGQGKNAFQAEIDSACELADFLRFPLLAADLPGPAVQPGRHLEPRGVPTAGRLRLRPHPVQLHRHRR
jgi:1-pyrroline-5-carboxylate dehydrogenase